MSETSEYKINIGSASLISECKRCHDAMTGELTSDGVLEDLEVFVLTCKKCGFKAGFVSQEIELYLEATSEG